MNIKDKHISRERRHLRLRKRVLGSQERPRLAVYKSNHYLYAQVIDDVAGTTIASASSLEKELRAKFKGNANKDVAASVGKLVGERAKAKGVKSVVFDRGGFIYHGRVRSLAEAARESGLEF
ncbi:50S ribosomal protein L18 [Deferribacterales bacterium RsTz2092]